MDAYIVSACRTPTGKAIKGAFACVRPEDLAAACVTNLLQNTTQLPPEEVDDLIVGCAFPEGVQGMNIARLIGLRANLPVSVPAVTVNRLCASGLQAIAQAAMQIHSGLADVVIAGGVESMSYGSLPGLAFYPTPSLVQQQPQIFSTMGATAENVAETYKISREEQDAFALRSHKNAHRAILEKRFEEEIVPVEIEITKLEHNNKVITKKTIIKEDEGVRPNTSLDSLAQLKPIFREGGTVTVGNTSQMSDGAAMLLLMSERKIHELNIKPMARFVTYAVGGVEPHLMGIGPTSAIPKALKLAAIKKELIDHIELNEAFAAQACAVIHLLGLDVEKVNPQGGAIALGHPLGATGAKLSVHTIYELKRRRLKYGLVTMCVGVGMGAAGIFENYL